MTFEEKLSAVFGLDDETWMRHANPWSVWTRTTVLPVLVISFWSRVERKPRTSYELTDEGERLFEEHVERLETLLEQLE